MGYREKKGEMENSGRDESKEHLKSAQEKWKSCCTSRLQLNAVLLKNVEGRLIEKRLTRVFSIKKFEGTIPNNSKRKREQVGKNSYKERKGRICD